MNDPAPSHPAQRARDRAMLDLAARSARRAGGLVEPNPLVGCVLTDAQGRFLAVAHHRRFGALHAEAEALAQARARHGSVRGGTAYVTLEPCNHHGKTPPCAPALIEAGIAQVVIARPDPNPLASGGAEALRAAGVRVRFTDASPNAIRLTDPFVKRLTTGLPWLIAKWAQTIDGRIATRSGDSTWISGPRSRALVHRWRGRVDTILTGVGTVLADDPRLTARIGHPPRRIALRAVVDPSLRIPPTAHLVRSAREIPTLCFCASRAESSPAAHTLRASGVHVIGLPDHPDDPSRLDLHAALRLLSQQYNAANVLVEAGPGLIGSLAREALIDEYRVFVAPILLGDPDAFPPANIAAVARLADAPRLIADPPRRIGEDTLLVFRARR